jgi:hypothetical protein
MSKITRSVIEGYLACHFKGYLKLTEDAASVPADDPASAPDASFDRSPIIATGPQLHENASQVINSVV